LVVGACGLRALHRRAVCGRGRTDVLGRHAGGITSGGEPHPAWRLSTARPNRSMGFIRPVVMFQLSPTYCRGVRRSASTGSLYGGDLEDASGCLRVHFGALLRRKLGLATREPELAPQLCGTSMALPRRILPIRSGLRFVPVGHTGNQNEPLEEMGKSTSLSAHCCAITPPGQTRPVKLGNSRFRTS
jgi:hypothetical protein